MPQQGVIDSLLSTVTGILAPHGPAVQAVAKSYTPGDFSVHLFLQLAIILILLIMFIERVITYYIYPAVF